MLIFFPTGPKPLNEEGFWWPSSFFIPFSPKNPVFLWAHPHTWCQRALKYSRGQWHPHLPHPFSLAEVSVSEAWARSGSWSILNVVVPSLPSLSSGALESSFLISFHTLTLLIPASPLGQPWRMTLQIVHSYMCTCTHTARNMEELRYYAQSLLFNGKQNKLQIIMTGKGKSCWRGKGASESIKQFHGLCQFWRRKKETRLFIICTGLVWSPP